jgi:hypothetical protein
MRIPEPGSVTVYPYWLAGGQVVTGNDFIVTPLFLRVEEVPMDRE